MNASNEYHTQLVAALSGKAENLERTSIRRLSEHLRGFEANVTSISDFLIEKGLLQDDPYRKERTVTEIKVPSSDPFAESEALTELSMRFSRYVAQWEFLVNIFHCSLPNFNLRNVKRLLELLEWIRWTDFSTNSSFQITRAFAQVMAKTSRLNDPIAGKIVVSSATQLRELTISIRKELKAITVFLRERYKWQVRDGLIERMGIAEGHYRHDPHGVLHDVKFEFSHRLADMGWYKELIKEILEEDYGKSQEALRQKVLEQLGSRESTRKKTKHHAPDDRASLLTVLDKLARCGEPMTSTLLRLNENARTLRDRKKSFGTRLKEILSTLFHKSGDKLIFEIEIKDPVTGTVRIEALDYRQFAAISAKKSRTLQDLTDPQSVPHRNSRTANPAQLLDYIERSLAEVKKFHRYALGLESFFHSKSIPPELSGTMKSSNLNIRNLKAFIGETLKVLGEYKSRKEDEEQLKKLGIEN